MTPQEAALAFGALPQQVNRQTRNAVRRSLSYWRKLTLGGVVERGIGKAIWGEKKLTSLRAIVKRDGDVEINSDGSVLGGLKITGIAALMETGGRTLPHDITTHGKRWRHPGSNVPATPSAAPVVGEVGTRCRDEIDKGMSKAVADAGLAG